MQTTYSQISSYWNNNPCSGGDNKFPFWLYKGKKVLEIGCGCGVDAERFVKAGAKYTGIDLTDRAIYLTRAMISETGRLYKMNAESLDFPDNYFDLVYSFGVIHHALHPEKIIKEIYRVLKPGGFIQVMLYSKLSFRYLIDILFLRRILWILRHPIYKTLRESTPHPTKDQWISWNTDNLGCPHSKVYSKKESHCLFKDFNNVTSITENWGWFRKIVATK